MYLSFLKTLFTSTIQFFQPCTIEKTPQSPNPLLRFGLFGLVTFDFNDGKSLLEFVNDLIESHHIALFPH